MKPPNPGLVLARGLTLQRKEDILMTIRVVNGNPYGLFEAGFMPIRGAPSKATRELEMLIAMAQVTGQATINVRDLDVVLDLPEPPQGKRPMGFQPGSPE